MREESGIDIQELRVDGGPTKNPYLMQFQSDMARIPVQVPSAEELSGIGVAYAAGVAAGIYSLDTVFDGISRRSFEPKMEQSVKEQKYHGWKEAVQKALTK
jgi:glycerol kinase